MSAKNPFESLSRFETNDGQYSEYLRLQKLEELGHCNLDNLPFTIRILLESALRNCDDFLIKEDDVIIGSGAQILGPVVVGKNSKIGANAVVTKDVPENAVMVGIPAKNVGTASEEFKPYGVAPGGDTKLDV